MTPNVLVGGYFQYGFGTVGDLLAQVCDQDGIDCSTHVMKLGVQVHYHVQPHELVDPWVGAGLGYEWFAFDVSGGGETGTFGAHDFEFLNLQAGLDLAVAPAFALGPFLSFSLSEYGTVTCEDAACAASGIDGDADIEDRSMHQWLTIGVRATIMP